MTTITGTFVDAVGNPLEGAPINLRPKTSPAVSGGYIVSALRYETTTDANGQISVSVAAGPVYIAEGYVIGSTVEIETSGIESVDLAALVAGSAITTSGATVTLGGQTVTLGGQTITLQGA